MIQRDSFASLLAQHRLSSFGSRLRLTVVAGLILLAVAMSPAVAVAQSSNTEDGTNVETQSAGFFQILFSGGPIGIAIILLLFGLSLTAAYLIFDHVINLRRKDILPDGLGDQVRNSLQAGKIPEAEQTCRKNPSLLSFVLLHGIAELEFGWSSVEKALEDATAEQSARLFRKIEYLSVIGNIAPMVGLLGTVVGMVMAFQQVASGGGTAGASELATGIYQALVTTVGGLIVAIPALGAFAIFRNRIDQLVAEAAYTAQHVFSPLRKKGKARSSSSSSK